MLAVVLGAGRAAAVCDDLVAVQINSRTSLPTAGEAALAGGVISGLLGTPVSISTPDATALARVDMNVDDLLEALATAADVTSVRDALEAEVTLTQILNAAGDTAAPTWVRAAASLHALATSLSGLTGSVRLGDIIKGNVEVTDLAVINVLDLVTAVASSYNIAHIPDPASVSFSPAALNWPPNVASVSVETLAREAPQLVVGGEGAVFNSSALRVRLHLGLVDTARSGLQPLNATATLTSLDLIADFAAAEGTLAQINALQQSIFAALHGCVTDLYVGTVTDIVFNDRSRDILFPGDVTPAVIGTLRVTRSPQALTFGLTAVGHVANSCLVEQTKTVEIDGPYPAIGTTDGAAVRVNFSGLFSHLTLGVSGIPIPPDSSNLINPLLGNVLAALNTGLLTPTIRSLSVSATDMAHVIGAATGDVVVFVSTAVSHEHYTCTGGGQGGSGGVDADAGVGAGGSGAGGSGAAAGTGAASGTWTLPGDIAHNDAPVYTRGNGGASSAFPIPEENLRLDAGTAGRNGASGETNHPFEPDAGEPAVSAMDGYSVRGGALCSLEVGAGRVSSTAHASLWMSGVAIVLWQRRRRALTRRAPLA